MSNFWTRFLNLFRGNDTSTPTPLKTYTGMILDRFGDPDNYDFSPKMNCNEWFILPKSKIKKMTYESNFRCPNMQTYAVYELVVDEDVVFPLADEEE